MVLKSTHFPKTFFEKLEGVSGSETQLLDRENGSAEQYSQKRSQTGKSMLLRSVWPENTTLGSQN